MSHTKYILLVTGAALFLSLLLKLYTLVTASLSSLPWLPYAAFPAFIVFVAISLHIGGVVPVDRTKK
ncbi:hypothetical protein ACNFIA_17010 [Pseudomonas sp. NY15437]|uniref:hypothetical protein n=1 Tax=Pseudomonas sp. NY15437 TaxID=3400360 RepID=UPI003A881F05